MAHDFRINKEYASKYNKWRQKEELQKLKDRYGDVDLEESSSSSSSEEDEDAEALTPQLEKDWLKTLAAIKSKDPSIYDKSAKFYHSETSSKSSSDNEQKTLKEKPMFLKDFERKVILEKGGVLSDEDESDEVLDPAAEDEDNKPAGYYEEQEEIRKGFKEALAGVDSDSEEELLIVRKKTKEEKEKEDTEYKKWLKEELADEKNAGIEVGSLKSYWVRPELEAGEQFLRDYILKKQYLEDDDDRIPTYDEIVNEDFSDEEEALEKQETFERKYNFRFEEPDPEFLKSYPRTISDSVRRKDDRRVKKRQEAKDKKEQEKLKRKEELKQLKNLKKAEIMDKLEKIKEITGNPSVGFSDKDLEGDFNPADYDKLMQKMFDKEYYDQEGGADSKPVFPEDEDLDLEVENWDNWQGDPESTEGQDYEYQEDDELHCEDPDFNMDADYDPNQPGPSWQWDTPGQSKKKKKKSKLARALEKKKPVFDPGNKTFEEYFDEYYKLDYEDMIGDQPCRFQYRQVASNDYGLNVDEVLSCRDKELNAWVSLKKMSQYRTEDEETFDQKIYYKKGKNVKKKLNILSSLRDDPEEETEAQTAKKTKGPKKTPHSTASSTSISPEEESMDFESRNHSGDWGQQQDSEYGNSSRKRTHSSESLAADNKNTSSKKKKQKLEQSKHKVSKGLVQDGGKTTNAIDKKIKKKKKLENATVNQKQHTEKSETVPSHKTQTQDTEKKKKIKKKKKKQLKGKGPPAMSDERLKAYGLNPKKFKYTQHKFRQQKS